MGRRPGKGLVRCLARIGPAVPAEDTRRSRRVEASCVVQIDAISAADAHRLTTLLGAAATGRDVTDQPLRIQSIYDEERAAMKLIVIGGPADTGEVMRLIDVLVGTES